MVRTTYKLMRININIITILMDISITAIIASSTA